MIGFVPGKIGTQIGRKKTPLMREVWSVLEVSGDPEALRVERRWPFEEALEEVLCPVLLQETVAIRLREKSSRRLEQGQSHFEVHQNFGSGLI
jgi:hypothetical protein